MKTHDARQDRIYAIVTVEALAPVRDFFERAGWGQAEMDDALSVSWRGCRLLYTTLLNACAAPAVTADLLQLVSVDDFAPVQEMLDLAAAPWTRGTSPFGPFVQGVLPGNVRLHAVLRREG